MPISVVVGGQFGSEGKGKVACALSFIRNARIAIRVGGPNSGHTVIAPDGRAFILRQIPTAATLPDVVCALPAGAYIQEDLLLQEIAETALPASRIWISPYAQLISEDDVLAERRASLPEKIGSTGSGTGAAVAKRTQRGDDIRFAADSKLLKPYVRDTSSPFSECLQAGGRVVLEGTQGFGLSLLHSGEYPYCTARDTTASAFLSEAGLSPMDVDEVVLVLRAFPIRVSGNSGPLPNEIDWSILSEESGSDEPLVELTSVTKKVRRLARFDAEVVRQAIRYNNPTKIVLNHIDYVDPACRKLGRLTNKATDFVRQVEVQIGRTISWVGFGPASFVEMEARLRKAGNDEY